MQTNHGRVIRKTIGTITAVAGLALALSTTSASAASVSCRAPSPSGSCTTGRIAANASGHWLYAAATAYGTGARYARVRDVNTRVVVWNQTNIPGGTTRSGYTYGLYGTYQGELNAYSNSLMYLRNS